MLENVHPEHPLKTCAYADGHGPSRARYIMRSATMRDRASHRRRTRMARMRQRKATLNLESLEGRTLLAAQFGATIAAENAITEGVRSANVWDVSGVGDPSIQG